MIRSTRLLAVLLGALLAVACGGEDAGTADLTGKVTAPDGYVAYEGSGVSFLHPESYKVARRPTRDGGVMIDVQPASGPTDTSGVIVFTIVPGGGERFESLLEQRRFVIGTAEDGEVVSDEKVDLEGAERVQRVLSRKKSARGAGAEVSAQSIDVLREGGDVLFLLAEAPQVADQPLDPEVVISSFRLTGS